MSTRMVDDHAERELARDPRHSVIVQAPAGSGKTELLMQRYLALLGCVADPEEILAVTFTRKAAAEMRNRILHALQPEENAAQLPETAALAAAVLRRDTERGWRLLEYPGRLRIRTLDSVNSWLRDSAPLSGDGSGGAITEQNSDLYERAASQTLEFVGDDSPLGCSIGVALCHMDNNSGRLVMLLAQMLQRRDQWLPLLGSGELGQRAREVLEDSLQLLVSHALEAASRLLGDADQQELLELLQYAAGHMVAADPNAAVGAWRELAKFPTPEPEALPHWRALADLLLVQSDTDGPALRKKLDKRNGFPTPKDGGSAELNARARDWLERMADNQPLADALDAIRKLPEPRYSDAQWEALAALVQVLPAAAAQLQLVFREEGRIDYIQIAQDALAAFGTPDAPTDLALRLDYRISHILIDEFQDTSRTQFTLLEKLTAGWSNGDGRTLFVVGDPMQSIYRFRQADVGLFLRLWEHGIGDLRLRALQLTTNFRSAPTIVEWVNMTFSALMPAHSDAAIGAVQFAPGTAFRSTEYSMAVPQLHACAEPGRVDEARAIADQVQATLRESPADTVGILVRTRHQARLLVTQLRQRGIAFAGAGLEQPGETSVEQDLLALTRALCHAGDRTAWLALLRAPWCGLSLQDLAALCEHDWQRTVYELLSDPAQRALLSPDGQARVQRLHAALDAILGRAGKLPLRDWVEGAWQQLGGPAALIEPRDLQLAAQYFATLEQYAEGSGLADAWRLHERLAEREDAPAGAEVRVHLLTIFKAKGLEYDTVILPALDGVTRRDDKQVLDWHEFVDDEGSIRYLMAPIEAAGDAGDPIQAMIRGFATEQAHFELDRLLYVAATRARKALHLYFELRRNKDGEVLRPRKGSLLNRLWPVIGSRYAQFDEPAGTAETREQWVQPKISRLQLDVVATPAPARVTSRHAAATESLPELTFDWAGSDAMRIGTVVHRCLQFIAEQQLPRWSDAAAIRCMLAEEGVGAATLGAAVDRVAKALELTLDDARGQWLLAPHEAAICEYPVTVCRDGDYRRLVVDRSFIDADGVRWVIDYKSSTHEGGNLGGFIAAELERYRPQLLAYCDALHMLDPGRPVRAALYFPLLQVFAELPGQNEPAN